MSFFVNLMKRSVIHIENGIPRHPDHRMPEPVTLDIYEGEQVAILGPNASGKTRLVEILTGKWPLLYGNEVKYDFGDSGQRLVSENIKLMTFRDSYGDQDTTYYLQKRWNQHEIDEDMPMVNGQPLISLSSGELRKYQLRRALASHPRLLIIDNPFIGLDNKARQQLHDTLEQLIRDGGLQVMLIVSREKDIPDFITRVINVQGKDSPPALPVREGAVTFENEKARHVSFENEKSLFAKNSAPSLTGRLGPLEKPLNVASSPQRGANSPFATEGKAGGESGTSSPLLQFSKVNIRYGSRTILHDFSWTVQCGEHWAITGDNGSGKSTLLSLICADNPQAYACDIRLFGRRRGSGESIWEIKRHIGYVSPELHRAYQKNVPAIQVVASGFFESVGLYVRPYETQFARCRSWMKLFGIEDLADRNFMQLSSGEQRLCLLTRAFVKSPDLLILDEPFHGLDDVLRARATRVIETYCSNPAITLLIVSHYTDELPAGITNTLHLTRPSENL